MASLDFEIEKTKFREFYDSNRQLLEDAKDSFITLVNALISHTGSISISKIDGRVKDKEECIRKFNLKYRTDAESKSEPYTIKDHITDLIGLRIVCLYEDDIEKAQVCLSEHFEVIDVTDKIAQIENTEGSFGYKGLHLDLKLNGHRITLPEYTIYSNFRFEVQIRTIIQDSWSVLDHKIKYKKSIPNSLKRRINTLAALFELADREFREIREATIEEMKKEEVSQEALAIESEASNPETEANNPEPVANLHRGVRLNAFSFLKIAHHFFSEFDFEPYKVDGFTQEITGMEPSITRGKFNNYMKQNISRVKKYQIYFEKNNPNDKLNPYTLIRHCLYLGNKNAFSTILNIVSKEAFEKWLEVNPEKQAA
jgi:putative GTP pyrophosphokinase